MKKWLYTLLLILGVINFTGCANQKLDLATIEKTQPKNSIYLEGSSTNGLILAHGQGKSPDWKVVGPLRKSINKELNFHTLSLQMPINGGHWTDYAFDFPKAHKTIYQAILFLQSKGVKKIYLMGHSMGSRMSGSFVSEYKDAPINGLIIVGCFNNGNYPLSCLQNVSKIKNIPILDTWGGAGHKDYAFASERKYLKSNKYTQIEIPHANHRIDGHDEELKNIVINWFNNLQ